MQYCLDVLYARIDVVRHPLIPSLEICERIQADRTVATVMGMVDKNNSHAIRAHEAGQCAVQKPARTNLRLHENEWNLGCVDIFTAAAANLILHLFEDAAASFPEELRICIVRSIRWHVQLVALRGAVGFLDWHEQTCFRLFV